MIGYKWFDTKGFFWRHHFKSLLPLSMPHIDPRLSRNKAQQLVRDHGVWFLRWDTEFDLNRPSDWWHVIKDNQEVTLKHFFLENGIVRLQPANPAMDPIYVPADKVTVQGRVVGVIRSVN